MVELTHKQEHFAQLLMDPEHSQASAYREAYDVGEDTQDETIYPHASRLAKHDKVKARLRELRVEAYKSDPWDVQQLRAKLEDRSDQAADAGQYGPSIRGLEMIGKLDGLIVDKKEIAIEGKVVHIPLSIDELRQLVLDGRRIAAEYGLVEGMEVVEGTARVVE